MLAAEHASGAAEAGLHFIGDQQRAMFVAQLACCMQKLRICRADASFALHNFDDNGRGGFIDSGREFFGLVVGSN